MADAAHHTVRNAMVVNYKDPSELGNFIIGILAIAVGFIPVVGEIIASMLIIVGQLFLPAKQVSVWDQVRQQVEACVKQRITEHHMETLKGKILGFQENMAALTGIMRQWQNATGDNKLRQAAYLRQHHTAFLIFVRGAIPEFQQNATAVASLGWFALAATMQMSLLTSGINEGASWGYTDAFIEGTLRTEYNARAETNTTASNITARAHVSNSCWSNVTAACRGESGRGTEMALLMESIQAGVSHQWSEGLLNTWRDAYSAMTVQRRDLLAEREDKQMGYRTYIEKQYARGRAEVQPHAIEPSQRPIQCEEHALKLRAYADYDSHMTATALMYVEYWPYMLQGYDMPGSVLRKLDREIFFGPYGCYSPKHARPMPWNATTPPAVVPRTPGNLTSFMVQADGLIHAYQQTWGGKRSRLSGNAEVGMRSHVGLEADEVVERIDLVCSYRLASISLISNKAAYGPYGDAHTSQAIPIPIRFHAPTFRRASKKCLRNVTVGSPGYSLTSAYITSWDQERSYELGYLVPGAAAGIVFGFRPTMLERREEPSNSSAGPFP